MNNADLSNILQLFGAHIERVWSGLDSMGYTFPALMRSYVKEFATSEHERERLDIFWKEFAREQLARAPFQMRFVYTERHAISGQAYRSEFLDSTLLLLEKSDYPGKLFLTERAFLRYLSDPGSRGLKSRPQQIRQDAIGVHRTHNRQPWIELTSDQQFASVESALIHAMLDQGISLTPRRYVDKLPMFRIAQMGDDCELVLHILASGRQLSVGFIDVRFSIIPFGQSVSNPFRAAFTPNLIVPFFQGYESIQNLGELEWCCSAISALAALVARSMEECVNRT